MNWRSDKLHSPKKYQVSDEVEAEFKSRVNSNMTSQQENGARRARSIQTEEVGSEFYMPTNEVKYTLSYFRKTYIYWLLCKPHLHIRLENQL